MGPRARLDKSGRWAVCAIRDCGTRLAQVVVRPREAYSDAGARLIEGRAPALRMVFKPGWVDRGDGVWHYSPRATNIGRQRDRARNLGIEPWNRTPFRGATPRPIDGRPIQASHGTAAAREAICPSCRSRQWVDPPVLLRQLQDREAGSSR